MADRSIGELVAASQIGSTDLLVMEQGGTAKKVTGQLLENWLLHMAQGRGGIQTIEKTGTSGITDTYTITFSDESTTTFEVENGRGITGMTSSKTGTVTTVTLSYSDGTTSQFTVNDGEGVTEVVPYWAVSTSKTTQPLSWSTTPQSLTANYKYLWNYLRFNYSDGTHQDTTPAVVGVYGDKGATGDTGTSITSVTKIGTSGLVDTYRITFSNNTTTTFTITNGSSISTIEKTSTSGLVDTYTVTLTNGETETFTVTNGKGISSITQISGSHAAGTSDTYRITYNDGDTYDFLVYNGANGTGAVSSVAGIGVSGSSGDVPLIRWGNGAPTETTVGQEKQLYFDLNGGVMYICIGVAAGSYSWASMGITVDSALSSSSNNPVQNRIITRKIGTESLDGFTATNLTAAANELMTKKAEKRATVANVTYDSTNHRLRKTVNGSVSTVMDVDTEPTEGSMNPITSDAAADLKGSLNNEKTKMPYLDGTTSAAITVANGTATNPNNTSTVHTVEQIPIKTGQVATVKVLRTPKVSGDKFVFGSVIRNSAGANIIYWDYNANSENRCSVKCDVPIVGGYVQFTIAESNGSTYTTLRSTDFTSGDVVISVEDANTLPDYSESFALSSQTAGADTATAAKVKICSYNVAKYNCDTTIPMSDEKVLNFRKFLDAYQFDYVCAQEDMQYYDNSSKDAVSYLYNPILPEYYRAGSNYDINIHCNQLAVGTTQKVMFTGVSSKSRAMQVCAFPIDGSNKKLLVCSVHCPYADKGGSYDSVENIALRNSVYQEIFKFINGDIQLNNVAGTAVSVPAHDYAVVCMDANCMTSTDKSNLLSAASAKNFKGANGGKFGWFNTCKDADYEYALDNIFVSSNIEFSKIEPLWSWFNDLYSDHVPLIAELLLVNAKTIYDCGTTPNWITVASLSYADVPITFNKTFTTQPTVFCSLISDSSSSEIGSLEAVVYSTTTSGATIRIYNNAATGRSPKFNWLAIGS